MEQVVEVFELVNFVAYVTLAAVAVARWWRRRERASLWAALAFGALGGVVLLGRVLPEQPEGLLESAGQRLSVVLLVVFPFLLYRFTTAFRAPSQGLELAAGALTAALVVASLAIPRYPAAGEEWPGYFAVYVGAFLLHWIGMSAVAAGRLWRAGRGQPTVSRRRMRLLALAATLLTVAIVLSALASAESLGVRLAGQIVGFLSVPAFLIGLAPPAIVRLAWRRPEQRRLQLAISDLMTSMSEREVAARVLPPMADIVGAHAVALVDHEGGELARHGEPPDRGPEPIDVEAPFGCVRVWTSRYAPFFGDEELALLHTLASLTGLALDRSRLFEQEREARAALERADAVKTNFVALAAHELRSPVTTLLGVTQTLERRRDEISEETRQELERALARQAERLALLVEQLLDLSRLDAEAVPIRPERVAVRERVEEIVASVAGGAEPDVAIAPEIAATLDPNAFDRIVGNLVANAVRYGEGPITISARQSDNHFRLAVEDRGDGVPEEFVVDLFERFTRAGGTREAGTGLGLAIARSYAQAHGGDLLYTPARPHGARFELVVPVVPVRAPEQA